MPSSDVLAVAHIDILLNGHHVQGPADEENPYDLEDDGELFTAKDSPDGSFYGSSIPKLGGVLTLLLQPTSPTARWFMNLRSTRDNALENGLSLPIISGSYNDSVQGRKLTLTGGRLLQAPKLAKPAITYKGMIRFQRVISNLDAAIMTGSAQQT